MARFHSTPDTFVVEEVPAYVPCGEGSHTYVWMEKRGLTTMDALKALARALRVPERDVGYAGLKDRHATTRQWISLPDVAVEAARAAKVDGLSVLEARRHGNKLRVGHLRANRFEVVLEDVDADEAGRFDAALRTLAARGLPNRYGAQRFGMRGDNVEAGLALLRGERRERDARVRKLLLSAVQSAVFNRTLELREARGGLAKVLLGDVLQKTTSSGLFTCVDPAVDQPRVDAGEIVPTGPMPGERAVAPPTGSEADALEAEAFASLGVTPALFASAGRDLPGTRRPVLVPLSLGDPAVAQEPERRLRLRFTLPAGSYATVLLDALGVADEGRRERRPDATGAVAG